MKTVTIYLPSGYKDGFEFAQDCGFRLAPQSTDPAQGAWQSFETAPKDGRTFVAISWHGSFEDSLSWVLYWNADHFEPTNAGSQVVDLFTHWMIPDASSVSSTTRGTP
jgi:hypothetical protein